MEKLAIITGVGGFVGHHLAQEFVNQGWKVIGVGREADVDSKLHALLQEYLQCDVTNFEEVRTLPLQQAQAVINLAGLAAVGPSFDNPDLYMHVNTSVLDTLCRAAIELDAKATRIVSVSSGAVYSSRQPMPLSEKSELDPDSSPYAKSKIAMEKLTLKYRNEGVDCVVARPFNHIGPGQGEGFILPDLYKKLTATSRQNGTIQVGNITTKRDYTDVRDVAKAYVSLVTTKTLQSGIYNVCSGRSLSGKQLLDLLVAAMDLQNLTAEVDEKLFRPSDAPDLYGDNGLLGSETGWAPTIPIETTIRDFIEWKSTK